MNNALKLLLLAGPLAICSHALAVPVTVYDSLTGESFTGGSGFNQLTEAGKTITLGSGPREITQIDLWLGAGAADSFNIRFYTVDGSNVPQTLLWESPTQTYPWDSPNYNRKILSFAVPNVVAPDTFAWSVVTTNSASMTVFSTGLPTIGSNANGWTRNGVQPWTSINQQFGARIVAVPESSLATLAVLLTAGPLAAAQWRGRHRRAASASLQS